MKKYDVVATTGTYMKGDQEKRKYENVGMVLEKDGRFYLKIAKLAFDDDGKLVNFFSLYEPKARESQAPQAQAAIQDDFDDPIPF